MNTRVKVKLTVEVSLGAQWGRDCTIEQVQKQASEAAAHIVSRRLTEADPGQLKGDSLRIVGIQAVSMVANLEESP